MTKALAILIVVGVIFVGWRVAVYWETVQEEQRTERKGEAARTAQLQNLPGLPPQLESSLNTARSRGERALGDWLKQFGHLVQDPRKAAIELDYCQLLMRSNPAEARRIFAAVRERTPAASPVYSRIKELERSFQGGKDFSGHTRVGVLVCPSVNPLLVMDIIFNCPKCEQELAVDSSGAGSEINCPSCGEKIVIPAAPPAPSGGGIPTLPHHEAHPINPIASSAAAKVEMHLKVPSHNKPSESLIQKPNVPLEVAAKESDRKIKVKTIRHTDCIEVGHDKFDEVVTGFLQRVGEQHIISINSLTYTHLDIGSQKLMTDYAVLVVYRG